MSETNVQRNYKDTVFRMIFKEKNRAEVIAMSIFEYDEEKHMKSEREEWREIGREEGRRLGLKK